MVTAKEEKRKVAHAMKDALYQKNEVEAEIGSINTKYKAEVEGLEKIEPIFQTLKKIKAIIMERRIAGFKGLLIDFLEFDPKISSIVDLSAKSKLFSVIVDDLNSAKEILQLN
jgi:chromosome segregation ATPase